MGKVEGNQMGQERSSTLSYFAALQARASSWLTGYMNEPVGARRFTSLRLGFVLTDPLSYCKDFMTESTFSTVPGTQESTSGISCIHSICITNL